MAHSMEEIARLIQNTRFKRRLVGGVDEDDVWKKLDRLQKEYEALLEALRQQHRGALEESRARQGRGAWGSAPGAQPASAPGNQWLRPPGPGMFPGASWGERGVPPQRPWAGEETHPEGGGPWPPAYSPPGVPPQGAGWEPIPSHKEYTAHTQEAFALPMSNGYAATGSAYQPPRGNGHPSQAQEYSHGAANGFHAPAYGPGNGYAAQHPGEGWAVPHQEAYPGAAEPQPSWRRPSQKPQEEVSAQGEASFAHRRAAPVEELGERHG